MQSILLWGTISSVPQTSFVKDGSLKISKFTFSFPQSNQTPDGVIHCVAFGKTAEALQGKAEGDSLVISGYIDTEKNEQTGFYDTSLTVMQIVNPREINHCSFVGNMPDFVSDVRYLDSGLVIAKSDLAVRKKKKDAKPNWLKCSFFGKCAEVISEYGKKGSSIGVSGAKLVQKRWTNKDGEERSQYRFNVNEISLLGSKPADTPTVEADAPPQPTAKPASNDWNDW